MIRRILSFIENKNFTCDTNERYDVWNMRTIYLSPVFFPFIDLFLVKNGFKTPKWGKYDFCVVLTHDVHLIGVKPEAKRRWKLHRLAYQNLGDSILINTLRRIKYEVESILGQILSTIGISPQQEDVFPIERWLEFEDNLGIKSTFFFFPDWEYSELDVYDFTYRFEDKIHFQGKNIPLYDVVKEIRRNEWEIGIHGGIKSARNIEILKKQKERTEKFIGKVKSIRHHYLTFDSDITPFIQKESGYDYDSTFGFNIICGFRAGTSFPFRWKKDQKYGTLEVPMIIQDGSLFRKRTSMGLGKKEALDFCRFMVDLVKGVGGVLVINWHTDNYLRDDGFDSRLLKEVILYAKGEGGWITSLENCAEYWEKNIEKKIESMIKNIDERDLIDFVFSGEFMKSVERKIPI